MCTHSKQHKALFLGWCELFVWGLFFSFPRNINTVCLVWFCFGFAIRSYCIAFAIFFRASIHKANGRLIAISREVSKLRDSGLDFSNRSEIWQAPRQQCCRDACQISERCDHYDTQSRDFETSRDLTVRRLPLSTIWFAPRHWSTKTISINFAHSVTLNGRN